MNPKTQQAEASVLGAVLVGEGEPLSEVIPVLGDTGAFFLETHHALLYEGLVRIFKSGRAVDAAALWQEFGSLDSVGGASYVAALTDAVGNSSRAAVYAENVRDNGLLRQLSKTLEALKREAEHGGEAKSILEASEMALLAISQRRSTSDSVLLSSVLPEALERLEKLGRADGKVTGAATGLHDLDVMTGGFKPGQLVVVAARPGIGKTAALLNWAHYAAVKQGASAQIFSLEMAGEELAQRLIAIEGPVNLLSIQRGFSVDVEIAKAKSSAYRLSSAKIEIVDNPRLTVSGIRGHVRRFVARHGQPALVAIDYIQLLHSGDHKSRARYEEVAAISGQLKQIARECCVPVLAACQLSRQAEGVGDGFKALQFLRESGSLEQDADCVVILGKPSDEEAKKVSELGGNSENLLSVCLAKNRHGRIGKFYARFEGQSQRIFSGGGGSIPAQGKTTAEPAENYNDVFEDEDLF